VTNRRASMHDGPLADLFRRTEAAKDAGQSAQPPAEPTLDETVAMDPPAPTEPPVAAAPEPVAEARPVPHIQPVPDPVDDEPLDEAPAARPAAAFARGEVKPSPLARDVSSAAYLAVIRVVGVGGAGVNAVDRMIEAGIRDVEFIAINTDAQQLSASEAPVRIHIGEERTKGLGSGARPEVGRESAEESEEAIRAALRGSDLVFIAAGEGGGTGTGAAPVVARIAREMGALTIGIVTTPFRFEGAQRRAQADAGIDALQQNVDTLIAIPNDRLLQVLDRGVSMVDAFNVADDVLRQGVQGVCDLITTPGLINLDFADVRTVMRDAGTALMGIGMASGSNRAREAAIRAVESPLVGHEIRGATGILLSVSGGPDLSLHDAMEIAEIVREAADDSCNVIFGATVDESLGDQVWVTVIATGFDRPAGSRPLEASMRGGAAMIPEFSVPVEAPATGDGGLDVPDFLR
jgi:cell division protein FtsZ